MLINYLSILCDSAQHETKQIWLGRAWQRALARQFEPQSRIVGTPLKGPGLFTLEIPECKEQNGVRKEKGSHVLGTLV